jgi:hypothetical protein
MFTLAEVAVRTDDRVLLKDMLIAAQDAHSTGSPAVRRGAAGILAKAAWQRDDVDEVGAAAQRRRHAAPDATLARRARSRYLDRTSSSCRRACRPANQSARHHLAA